MTHKNKALASPGALLSTLERQLASTLMNLMARTAQNCLGCTPTCSTSEPPDFKNVGKHTVFFGTFAFHTVRIPTHLWRSYWASLSHRLAHLRRKFGRLTATWTLFWASWALLSPTWAQVGSPWLPLGLQLERLGRLLRQLCRSWVQLAPARLIFNDS